VDFENDIIKENVGFPKLLKSSSYFPFTINQKNVIFGKVYLFLFLSYITELKNRLKILLQNMKQQNLD